MNALRETGRQDRSLDSISRGDNAAVCPVLRLIRLTRRESSAAALENAAGQKFRRTKVSNFST